MLVVNSNMRINAYCCFLLLSCICSRMHGEKKHKALERSNAT